MGAGLTGPPPSMTPPVRTVVFPPSYGVTSFFEASTNTRAWRARSRRLWRAMPFADWPYASDADASEEDEETEERVPQDVADSSERKEKADEETEDAREDERE